MASRVVRFSRPPWDSTVQSRCTSQSDDLAACGCSQRRAAASSKVSQLSLQSSVIYFHFFVPVYRTLSTYTSFPVPLGTFGNIYSLVQSLATLCALLKSMLFFRAYETQPQLLHDGLGCKDFCANTNLFTYLLTSLSWVSVMSITLLINPPPRSVSSCASALWSPVHCGHRGSTARK